MTLKTKTASSLILESLLALASLYYIGIYLYIVLSRITYPFELEWMEGGSVEHVRRILEGKNLYVEPSLEFVPYIYTPFYFYLSAFFSKIFGLGLFSLRLVSFLSSLGIFCLLFLMIYKETRRKLYGLTAVGLFIGTFRLSGAWMDIARVDSLFLFLFILGFYFLFFKRKNIGLILGSIFIFLSFMTKQTALMMSVPLAITLFVDSKKRGGMFTLLLAGAIIASTLIADWQSHSWYSYYVFVLPKLHPWIPEAYLNYWKYDLGNSFLLASVISLYFFIFGNHWKNDVHYRSFFIGVLIACWFSRLHSGGYDNVLIPIYMGIALLVGIALGKANSIEKETKIIDQKNILYFILVVQFLFLYFPIQKQIPTTEDRKSGEAFIQEIKALPGNDILIPNHPYYAFLAGKNKSGAQMMAIYDILRARDHSVKTLFYQRIQKDLLNASRPIIILDAEWFPYEINQSYFIQKELFTQTNSFFPFTGAMTRPRWIYRTKLDR